MDHRVGAGIEGDELNRIELGIDTLAAQFSSHNGGSATSDHPQATTSQRGFMSSTDKSKLNNIENNAKNDQTAAEILTAIKTVDGTNSGLDADTVDGLQGAQLVRSDQTDTVVTLRFGSGSVAAPSIALLQCD